MRRAQVVTVVLLVLLAWARVHAAAPAGRYSISPDTVKDGKTELVWQRTVPPASYAWADAKLYCEGLSLAGFTSGWRLPAKKELETLVDARIASPGPTIDSTAFPGTPNSEFWTATPEAGSATKSWYVNFHLGNSYHGDVVLQYRVRCVR